jgi:hypothetical protein
MKSFSTGIRWFGIAALVCVLCPAVGFAAPADEEEDSRIEVFGGYSWKSAREYVLEPEEAHHHGLTERTGAHGFDVAGGIRLKGRVKLIGEISGHFNSKHGTSRDFDYLAGPQLEVGSFHGNTAFVHALAGVGRSARRAEHSGEWEREFAPALGIGGGLDYHLSRNWAIRYVQVDWNPTFVHSPGGGRTRMDDVEISFGIVFLHR